MLIQIQTLRVFREMAIKLQWQNCSPSISWGSTQVFLFTFPPILSTHGNIVPLMTNYLNVGLPLCTKMYNLQELPQDEHYGNC